jgi:tRNA 2-thiouridine synthesizing protein D
MAKITVIVGEPPYGTERLYTALRFVIAATHQGHSVNLFLFEDAVFAPKKGQKPQEFPIKDEKMPRVEQLLKAAISEGVKVLMCGVCSSERAVSENEIIEGVKIGSMKDLVNWVLESDKVVTF